MGGREKLGYRQVLDILAGRIGDGYYHRDGRGGRLPTQKQMREEFGVGNLTLRFALAILEDRGLITSRRGKAYFVVSNPPGSLDGGQSNGHTGT